MSALLFCRECAEGKHGNCDGVAWSNELDGPAPCTCPDLSHPTRRVVTDHVFSPGKFSGGCMVQLARYPCPWPKADHAHLPDGTER